MSIAFVFSGQGAQYEGMCRELADKYPIIKETYEQAQQILGYDLLALSQEQLNQTRFTQPAIFTMSTAISRLLKEKGLEADVVAGLSLGEYSALVYAEALTFEEALVLLANRGLFMEEAAQEVESKMIAVMNAERETVESVCKELENQGYKVWPANYNMPGQIVVAGDAYSVDLALEAFKEKGVKRCIPLAVSGAFHTQLMQTAADKLLPILQAQNWKKPKMPVMSNTYAKDLSEMNLAEVMYQQVTSPVYWEDLTQEMISMGVQQFVEIGPKKVLGKFIQKIDREVEVLNVEDEASLIELLSAFGR